jgi:2'-5' RNA ligase
VQASCQALLHSLNQAEPEQYCYQPHELHVTVLSLFTANPNIERYLERLPRYQAVLQTALVDAAPFEIVFRGVTASPAAVLVQGFPVGDGLEQLRERLRSSLAAAGFGADLDQRYRIRTAHMTLLRFRSPLRNPRRFVELLAAARESELGTTVVHGVQLVQNDWYMSAGKTRTLAEYPL